MGDFFDTVQRQRACRQFSDETVSDALIEQLINAAIRAPSAENRQPWEFIVAQKKELRQQLAELMQRAWEGGARQWSEQRLSKNLLRDVDAGMSGGMAGAPVMIVVCGNVKKGMEMTLPASIYPAVQNLLLAATDLKLGSTLTTIAMQFEEELQLLLNLPEYVKPMALIPLGYPAKSMGLSKRKPFDQCTYRDRFDNNW